MRKTRPVAVVALLTLALSAWGLGAAWGGTLIADVQVSSVSFNPSAGQQAELKYHLGGPARVTISVCDPDHMYIRRLASQGEKKSGDQVIAWDGKDDAGTIVPDEAYYFVIEAQTPRGAKEVYDPTVVSGGEWADITAVRFDRDAGTLGFRLPAPARVLLRAGIKAGPMLRTILDWSPRPAGENIVHWNGRDESGVLSLYRYSDFVLLVTYFTLPDTSVITYGASGGTFMDYRAAHHSPTPKPTRPRTASMERFSPHFLLPRSMDRSPTVEIGLPEGLPVNEVGLPVISGRTQITTKLAGHNALYITEQRYEIGYFVDMEFVTEEEEGYSPHRWIWDAGRLAEGEHILTVNVVTMAGQVGAASKRVYVRPGPGATDAVESSGI